MPESISVSATAPDKLVVNGVDLLNRNELSNSQNRELQRYIDGHLHLLGYLDKEKQEKDGTIECSLITGGKEFISPNSQYGLKINVGDMSDGGLDQSLLNRTNSPASSDYSGKRKGVSWSDANEHLRARSYSPTRFIKDHNKPINQVFPGQYDQVNSSPNGYPSTQNQIYGDDPWRSSLSPRGNEQQQRAVSYDPYSRKPWGKYWVGDSRENLNKNEGYGNKGFRQQIVPTYSTLERSKDDYNKFDTTRFREQQNRSSRERDDVVRFHGYGDHRVSGVCEPKPVYWQGGEMINDPTYLAKSIRPRRFFYSPIGDGVVAADGIELKRLPPDLTPKVTVINQKIVEPGDPGRAGVRLTERTWDEGDKGPRKENGLSESWHVGMRDDDRNKNKFPTDGYLPAQTNLSEAPMRPPFTTGLPYEVDDDSGDKNMSNIGDRGGYPRPDSGLSFGSSGPREGWTKTFIVNPRECINIYGSETSTTIFDLEDHTPKTTVTIKETLSPAKDVDVDNEETK